MSRIDGRIRPANHRVTSSKSAALPKVCEGHTEHETDERSALIGAFDDASCDAVVTNCQPNDSALVQTMDAHDRSSVMSDTDEKECVFQDALVKSGAPELRRIDVSVEDGRVMLFGRVSSFYLKQLAQEALRPCAIGMEIDNQIKVGLKA